MTQKLRLAALLPCYIAISSAEGDLLRCSAQLIETKYLHIPCKDLKSTIVTVGGIRVKEIRMMLRLF